MVSDSTGRSLRDKTLHAFAWSAGGTFVRVAIQFVAQVCMARLLGPDQIGVFAISVAVVAFTTFFSDCGLAYGLIQRREVSATDIRFVFTWQMVLGFIVTGLLAMAAPYLALLFSEPRLSTVLVALAPLALIQAATAVSQNLLRKNLDFRTIQIVQTIAYVTGYVIIGLPLAILGWGVWALVVAWLTQCIAALSIFYLKTRHAVRPLLLHPSGSEMVGFGLKVLLTNIVNWVVNNADRLLLARLFPASGVGLYSTSYNISYTPASAAMSAIQPVLYSACAQAQQTPERIRSAYLSLASAIALFVLPLFWTLGVLAEPLILLVYGDAWAGAVELVRPFMFAMPFFLLWNITTPPLWAAGDLGKEVKLQLPIAVIWLLTVGFCAQYSIGVVAWSVLGLFVARWLAFVLLLSQTLRVSISNYSRELRGGLAIGIVASGAAALSEWVLVDFSIFAGGRLVSGLLVATLLWRMVLELFPCLISPNCREIIRRARERLPAMVSKVIWVLLPR